MQNELEIWEAIKFKVGQFIGEHTKRMLQCARYDVTTPPDGKKIGVKQPFSKTELFLPYSHEVDNAKVGDTVLVVWWGTLSTAKVWFYGNGPSLSGGSGGVTEKYVDDAIKAAIGNGKLTIKQNGVVKGVFNANQINDIEIELDGGDTSAQMPNTSYDAPLTDE